MKYFLISMLAIAGLSFSFKPGDTQGLVTEKFKVYGNCSMCKARIEKALKVNGVRYAVWDQDTKILTVKYNPKVITLDQLHQKVADVGHDTGKVKAKDEVYNNLHACCQYDRKA
jgi:copper chaperone CopZ